MGGAQLEGLLPFEGDRVHGDDLGGARDRGPHHRAHSHAARPDDDHGVPVADAGGADRGAVSGDNAAAGHGRDRRGNVSFVAHDPDLLDQRVLGERAELAVSPDLASVTGGEGERSVRAGSGQHVQVGVADVGPAVGAVPALAAGGQGEQHHRVADGDPVDAFADGDDDPRALVPAYHGKSGREVSRDVVVVAVAQPGVLELHQDLARPGIGERAVDDLPGAADFPADCGAGIGGHSLVSFRAERAVADRGPHA